MSYWKGFQEVKNTPTIQEKVDVLQKVTKELKMRKGFGEEMGKIKLGRF